MRPGIGQTESAVGFRQQFRHPFFVVVGEDGANPGSQLVVNGGVQDHINRATASLLGYIFDGAADELRVRVAFVNGDDFPAEASEFSAL